MAARELEGTSDILLVLAADNQGRMPVDHGVVQGPGAVVVRVTGAEDISAQGGPSVLSASVFNSGVPVNSEPIAMEDLLSASERWVLGDP